MQKQSSKYFKEYYNRNKKRIADRHKVHYLSIKADPIKREDFKKRCTEASRRWRAKHPETSKQSRDTCRTKRRLKALVMVGGAVCKRCGCTDLAFLEINHKNGGGCKEYRKIGNKLMDDILTLRRGTDDLEVLCRVCNALDYLEHKDVESAKRFKITWN